MQYKGKFNSEFDLINIKWIKDNLCGKSFPTNPEDGQGFILTKDNYTVVEKTDSECMLSGWYRWKDNMNLDGSFFFAFHMPFKFTSIGETFDTLCRNNMEGGSIRYCANDYAVNKEVVQRAYIYPSYYLKWLAEGYKVMNFGTTPQQVCYETSFWNFFQSKVDKINGYFKAGVYVYNATTSSWVCIADLSEAVSVDNTTIEKNAEGKLQLKDAGITFAKFNTSALSNVIPDTSPSAEKVTKESDVFNYVNNRPDENILTYDSTSHKYTLKAKTASDKGKSWVLNASGAWVLKDVTCAKTLEIVTKDASKFIYTFNLKDVDSNVLSAVDFDLPLELMGVVSLEYDNITETFKLKWKDATDTKHTLDLPTSSILKGVVTQIASQTLTNKTINAPDNSITNLAVANFIASALNKKGDTLSDDDTHFITSGKAKEELDLKQLVSNLVTSISSSSTDLQYPSAKLLYDQLLLKMDVTKTVLSNQTRQSLLVSTGSNNVKAYGVVSFTTAEDPQISGTKSAFVFTNEYTDANTAWGAILVFCQGSDNVFVSYRNGTSKTWSAWKKLLNNSMTQTWTITMDDGTVMTKNVACI